MPTSLITGTIGLVAEKARDHVLSKKKDAMVTPTTIAIAIPVTDSGSPTKYPMTPTSKRPTIIDFMTKTKRSINADKDDCSCSGKLSMADVIGEHVVDKNVGNRADVNVTPEHELEEVANGRSKRSNDNNANHRSRSPCSESSCLAFPPKQSQQPQSTCSTGNCDRIET